MMFKTTAGLAAATLLALGAAAPQAGAASTKTVAAKTATAKVHSPASIECSKQADAKGLHGKERVKFRAECKKTYAAEHKSAAAPAETHKAQ